MKYYIIDLKGYTGPTIDMESTVTAKIHEYDIIKFFQSLKEGAWYLHDIRKEEYPDIEVTP